MIIVSDIGNLFLIYIFLMFLIIKYKISNDVLLVLFLHSVFVFLTNGVMFSPSYMPDQFRYFNLAHSLRTNLEIPDFDTSYRVYISGLVFGFFPIPFIESLHSVSLINYTIYSIIFIYFYQQGILRGMSKWFYLLYPSLAFYSSIAGRDILIFTITIFSIHFIMKKRYVLANLVSILLLLIKPQNYIIFIFALAIYSLLSKKVKIFEKTIYILILGVVIFAFQDILSLDYINRIRRSMYVEDGGDLNIYVDLANYSDFLLTGIKGFFYFLLKPFLWESANLFQKIQSIENIVIFLLIINITYNRVKFKINNNFLKFLDIYFIIAIGIYGIVVFNFGTAARYRFIFITIFIMYNYYFINQYQKKSFHHSN